MNRRDHKGYTPPPYSHAFQFNLPEWIHFRSSASSIGTASRRIPSAIAQALWKFNADARKGGRHATTKTVKGET